MSPAVLIAGDWGTTHLRLYLVATDGEILASLQGPGARDSVGRFAQALEALVSQWPAEVRALPVILCGMVGSSLGWTQATYVTCPARPEQIANSCVALQHGRVHVVPGLSCLNRLQAPDVLRGEETQILGALRLHPLLHSGRHLLCLPGTHTKWVVLQDGVVSEFLTAPTGELFAVLSTNTILVSDERQAVQPTSASDESAYTRGVERFHAHPDADLLHQLFEVRSRRLFRELDSPEAGAYLSGLLIAHDVHGALRLMSEAADSGAVYIIGSPQLVRWYQLALQREHRLVLSIDAGDAVIAGMLLLQQLLPLSLAQHAL